jgi:integrase
MELLKVEEAWELYRVAVLGSSTKHSRVIETGRWDNYIAPVLGELTLEQLSSRDYLMLRRSLEDKKLSPQTVYHCLSLLRRCLLRAVEWGYFKGQVPSFKGSLPRFDNKRQRFLSKIEADMLLHMLKQSDKSMNWHDIALFALNTGLRRGEIFKLNMTHINFDSCLLMVSDTKSCRNRNLPLNKVAMDILNQKKN